MGKIYYKNQEYTGSNGGGGGDVPSSAIPTANTISKFDNSAKMNSTDMTSTEITNLVNSLDTQGANLADYVIEQGISDSWTYRKWNSGIAECWERRQIGTTTFSSQEGYGYYAGITNRSFPTGLFNANPTITFGVLGGGGLVSFCPSTISNTYYGGYLWCSANGTRSIAILSHAIGTWK